MIDKNKLTIEQEYLFDCLYYLDKASFIIESNILNRNRSAYGRIHDALDGILSDLEDSGLSNRSDMFEFIWNKWNKEE